MEKNTQLAPIAKQVAGLIGNAVVKVPLKELDELRATLIAAEVARAKAESNTAKVIVTKRTLNGRNPTDRERSQMNIPTVFVDWENEYVESVEYFNMDEAIKKIHSSLDKKREQDYKAEIQSILYDHKQQREDLADKIELLSIEVVAVEGKYKKAINSKQDAIDHINGALSEANLQKGLLEEEVKFLLKELKEEALITKSIDEAVDEYKQLLDTISDENNELAQKNDALVAIIRGQGLFGKLVSNLF